jgi:hypothetical protein
MDLSKKRLVKTGVRLFGIAFGLAIAMFLFSSVAFGHSNTAKTAATPTVAHTTTVSHQANWGGGFDGGFGRGCFGGGCFGGFNRGFGFNSCFRGCFNPCRSFCDFGCFGGNRFGGFGGGFGDW